MECKTFIFIAGVHKSGTSLLHELIKTHYQISGFENTGASENEGQHLQTVYPSAKAFGGAGYFGFNEQSFMTEKHPCATPENSIKLYREWLRYWNPDNNYFIEKSPPNIVRTRFLQSLFSNTFFIVILRHPVAVSYATQKWRKTSVRTLIQHTLICYERFLNDMPYLKNKYVLRYEDLISNPKKCLDNVFRYLKLDSVNINEVIYPNLNEKYFNKWIRGRQNIFKKRFFNKTIDMYEKRVRRFGYSLIDLYSIEKVKYLGM